MNSRWSLSDRRRRQVDDESRILPLINVVFLLLIVVMLASQLNEFEPFQIEPPYSDIGIQPEIRDVTILMDASGRLAINGSVIEPEELRSEIAARILDGTVNQVRLKADGAAVATQVISIMTLLRDAGVETLHLLATGGSADNV